MYEGLGFSLVEAQALGIQCIATDNLFVSKESDIKEGIITWLPLERGAKNWADVIYDLPVISDSVRCKYGQYIIKAGYCMNDETIRSMGF